MSTSQYLIFNQFPSMPTFPIKVRKDVVAGLMLALLRAKRQACFKKPVQNFFEETIFFIAGKEEQEHIKNGIL
jgi:hypothetical protein